MVVSLYVCEIPKNINKKDIEEVFSEFEGYIETRIKLFADNAKICFIDFENKNNAQFAIETLQNFKFSEMDKGISIKFSEHQKKEDGVKRKRDDREKEKDRRKRSRSRSISHRRKRRSKSKERDRKDDHHSSDLSNVVGLINTLASNVPSHINPNNLNNLNSNYNYVNEPSYFNQNDPFLSQNMSSNHIGLNNHIGGPNMSMNNMDTNQINQLGNNYSNINMKNFNQLGGISSSSVINQPNNPQSSSTNNNPLNSLLSLISNQHQQSNNNNLNSILSLLSNGNKDVIGLLSNLAGTKNEKDSKKASESDLKHKIYKFDDKFNTCFKNLRRNASNIVFIEGLPADATEREVAHILRPFPGFRTCRVKQTRKEQNGRKSTICFCDFDEVFQATICIHTLQGYRFDKNDLVGLHFGYGVRKYDSRGKSLNH